MERGCTPRGGPLRSALRIPAHVVSRLRDPASNSTEDRGKYVGEWGQSGCCFRKRRFKYSPLRAITVPNFRPLRRGRTRGRVGRTGTGLRKSSWASPLGAMNISHETTKERGATNLIPGSMIDSSNALPASAGCHMRMRSSSGPLDPPVERTDCTNPHRKTVHQRTDSPARRGAR